MYDEDVISNNRAGTLVEPIRIPNDGEVTSVTFDGINGDNVQKWVIDFDIFATINPSAVANLYMIFNGSNVAGNIMYRERVEGIVSGAGVDTTTVNTNTGSFRLATMLAAHSGYKFQGTIEISPMKTNIYDDVYSVSHNADRKIKSSALHGVSGVETGESRCNGSYIATDTITSITLVISGSNLMHGVFELFEEERCWE